jgi:hypothetical protein
MITVIAQANDDSLGEPPGLEELPQLVHTLDLGGDELACEHSNRVDEHQWPPALAGLNGSGDTATKCYM